MDTSKTSSIFSTQINCIKYLERVRWQGKPICPYCKAQKSTPAKKENRHHCNICGVAFSVTVRTVFHDTRLPLRKWFFAIRIILTSRDSISSRQLAKRLKINRNTAWRLISRVYDAMIKTDERQLLLDIVKMQE